MTKFYLIFLIEIFQFLRLKYFNHYPSVCCSRNVEIMFHSLQVLAQFVTAAECAELISTSPEIVKFCLDGYQNTLSQSDFRTDKFLTHFAGDAFLKLLSSLSAASALVCSEFVRLHGLAELRAALLLDPNGCVQGTYYLYLDVRHAAEILWQVLRAENGRHLAAVRAEEVILSGIHVIFTTFPEIQRVSFIHKILFFVSIL